MALFKKNQKTNLGIDIGASVIKLVELEKEKERYKLKTYGILPMDKYLRQQGQEFDPQAPKVLDEYIIEMIKKIIQEANISAKQARLSVPVYSSFSTLVDLPIMPEKEIAAAIPFEAKKYIPVPITDVILDWSIIEKKTGKNGSIQVLLVAVLKEVIEKYTKVIQSIGLQLQFMEAETFSLARALVGNDKSAIVLVDIGARASNISIIDKGFIRSTRNLEMGGREFTKAISQKMEISLDKADVLKKSKESWPELDQIIDLVADKIIKEVSKIIDFYQTKYNRQIEKCILVGGAMGMVNLLDYFSRRLNLEVSMGRPFARIVYPPLLEPTLKELGPSLAVAAGLAMRE